MSCLRLVRLDALHDRPVTDLSGGQQQRVALARAIVTQPMVLLMDEPLSNLDARLREEMRLELRKIATSAGVTTLYVTHDQAEALSLGDKICVMSDGKIQQMGTPKEVYSDPPNLFVAEFVGEMNFIKASVAGANEIVSPLGKVMRTPPPESRIGDAVTLAIRPQYIGLERGHKENSDSPRGVIKARTFLGDAALYEVELADTLLTVRLPGESDFAPGENVSVVLPEDHWHVFS